VFLASQKPTYGAAVLVGYAGDALALIQHKYLKHFPIDLPHNKELTEKWLASVNNKQQDPDQIPPDVKSLSKEDYVAAMKALESRQKLLAFHRAVSAIFVLMPVCSESLCYSSKSNIGFHTST
jgi:hypothetical protein